MELGYPVLISEISFENFRVFKNKCTFELAPITILTGANSSGKSSVIKAMKLMRNFFEAKKTEENESWKDLYFNDLDFEENDKNSYRHQLGKFESVVNKDNKEKEEFSITYKIPKNCCTQDICNPLGNLYVVYTFCSNGSTSKNGRLKTSTVYLEDSNNDFVKINEIDYINRTQNEDLQEDSSKYIPKSKFDFEDLFRSISLDNAAHFILPKEMREQISQKEIDLNLKILTYSEIEFLHEECEFIESVRANTQRFYTVESQGTSFNHFLSKFREFGYSNYYNFYNRWIRKFDIGDEIDCDSSYVEDVGSQVNIKKNGKLINLADLGYGITQIVALLIRIIEAASEEDTTYIIIEEPETNLHPKYQSLLADLFIDAYKGFNVYFLIETHSEYLIRKLQYLTAFQTIEPKEVVIHYIGDPDEAKRKPDEEQITTIYIESNGQLTKPFGSGFTDESSKWLKEMWKCGQNS